MSQRKYLLVLSLSIITVFTSCQKDEENDKIEPSDKLEQFGILGKWRLHSTTINGITNMLIRFDTIEFIKDSEIDDLKGEFRNKGAVYETNGQFELDTANNLIHFDYNNKQKSYIFDILDDWMTFTYSEDDIEYIEDWRKE